jgi:conjugative relaxase-like TrwC/TraI family protein
MRPLNISGSQARDYYYDKDPLFGDKDNSQWQGGLADQFGLSGTCAEPDFLNAISGNDPRGTQIIQDGVNGEHRAAIDIPLAAPKSVSVMALHAGDKNLVAAHQKAVADTIDYIERNYLYARKTVDGVTRAFKTGNGLFATFMHSTSRANDPHLHTHTLTLNMTQTDAGYRAVFNDPIFKDQTLINYIYQSELAKNVRALGYAINNDAKGKWEIAGFSDQWIERFSTRSREIDEALEHQKGSDQENGAKKRDRAQKSSRAAKDHELSPEQLRDRWQAKLSRQEILESVEAAKSMGQHLTDRELSARQYLAIAYKAIHENESTFTRQDVVKVALELSRGQYTVADIDMAFYDAVKDKELEYLKVHRNKKGLETIIYTSRHMRLTEQKVVKLFGQHRDDLSATVDPKTVRSFLNSDCAYFTDGQKKVVENILTSKSRFTIVQGDAGTGKTSALGAVKQIIDQHAPENKIEINGLGYTGKASREIVDKAGIASQTLHSFLNKKKAEPGPGPKIWVVDESSMVGSLQMQAVMDRAIEHDARVVFIGDGKQLQAISAGRLFKDLQSRGHVEVVKMEEALRQKTDYMKAAVLQVKQFQERKNSTGVDDAFKILEGQGQVKQIAARGRRIQAAAKWMITHPDPKGCLIVTLVNEDRVAVNEIIHDALKAKDRPEMTVDIHVPVYLNGTSRYFAKFYREGQKAFVEHSTVAGLKAGQEVTITGVDVEKNGLTLKSGAIEKTVDLKKGDIFFSVYNVEQRRFFEGEKIVFLKNDKTLDLYNGQTATIKNLGPGKVITVRIDGQEKDARINLDYYPYLDRGYAVTVHKSQGQTAKEVAMLTDSKCALNKTETLYVALSRAQNAFALFTDDIDAVKSQMKQAQPKTTTMELVRDLEKNPYISMER